MKKFINTFILSAFLFASLGAVLSCGEDKKAGNTNASIKAKAESIVRRAAEATAVGDYDKYYKIIEEEQNYASSLTPEQINYYNQCAMEYAERMMSNF